MHHSYSNQSFSLWSRNVLTPTWFVYTLCNTHLLCTHQTTSTKCFTPQTCGGIVYKKKCCTLYGQQLCLTCFQWLMLVQGEMYFWFSKFLCNASGLSLCWVWVHSCWLGFVDIQGQQTRNTNKSVHLNIQITKVHVCASDTGACSQNSIGKSHEKSMCCFTLPSCLLNLSKPVWIF